MMPDHQNHHPEKPKTSSHAFPSIGDDSPGNGKTNTAAEDRFKPLYMDLQSSGEADKANPAELTEEQVRKNGFQRGFVAGRQEAVEQIQQEIVPHVMEFATELSRLREYLSHMERDASRNIPRVIKSIAEKILCGSLDLAPEEMKALRAEISKYFNECYQMHLVFNTADANLIGQFLDTQSPQWKESPDVVITSEENVRKGALKRQTEPGPTLPNSAMKSILKNMLVKASTK